MTASMAVIAALRCLKIAGVEAGPTGINPQSRCSKLTASRRVNREKTMSNTRTMLATLALGAAVAVAGPAFADKMKVTLDGKPKSPPTPLPARAPPTSTTMPPARS